MIFVFRYTTLSSKQFLTLLFGGGVELPSFANSMAISVTLCPFCPSLSMGMMLLGKDQEANDYTNLTPRGENMHSVGGDQKETRKKNNNQKERHINDDHSNHSKST